MHVYDIKLFRKRIQIKMANPLTVDYIEKNYSDPNKGGNVGRKWRIRMDVSNKLPTGFNEQVDHMIECQLVEQAMDQVKIAEGSKEAFAIRLILNHPVNLQALDMNKNIEKGQRIKNGKGTKKDLETFQETYANMQGKPWEAIAKKYPKVVEVFTAAETILLHQCGEIDLNKKQRPGPYSK